MFCAINLVFVLYARRQTMDTPLLNMITTALTATDSAPQSAGLDFDPENHRIVGEVPMPVRNLHNLGSTLAEKQQAILSQADGEDDLRRQVPRLREIKQQFEIVDALRWALLREAYPTPEAADGLAILHDWQAAHTFNQQTSDMPTGLREMLERIAEGEVHVMVAGFGRK